MTLTDAASLAALVLSVGAIIFAGLQWKAADRAADAAQESANAAKQQVDEAAKMRQLAEAAAITAKQSATAATESANAAHAALVLGHRASVTVSAITIHKRYPDRLPMYVSTDLANRGSSPALDMTSGQWIKVLPALPDPPDYSGAEPTGIGVMGPSAEGSIPMAIQITHDEQFNITHNHAFIFLYGFVRYRDSFGGNHETKWAYVYNALVGHFNHASHHNSYC